VASKQSKLSQLLLHRFPIVLSFWITCCYCTMMARIRVAHNSTVMAFSSSYHPNFGVGGRRLRKRSSGSTTINLGASFVTSGTRSLGNRKYCYCTPYSRLVREYITTRLFGSKPGSGVEGLVMVENEQDSLRNIDVGALEDTMRAVRDILGYSTYDVSLFLSDDKEVREMNYETRGVNSTTDILSFQLHEAESPGKLKPPEFPDVDDYYTLGDMLISVPYVRRVCKRDQKEFEKLKHQKLSNKDGTEDQAAALIDDDDDRGVSFAMSKEFDPEIRIHMLLVHGMLHLVGYDHIEDEDYEIMVAKEEKVLRLLLERKGSFLATKVKNYIPPAK
jgi:probable rRNA maturation factor